MAKRGYIKIQNPGLNVCFHKLIKDQEDELGDEGIAIEWPPDNEGRIWYEGDGEETVYGMARDLIWEDFFVGCKALSTIVGQTEKLKNVLERRNFRFVIIENNGRMDFAYDNDNSLNMWSAIEEAENPGQSDVPASGSGFHLLSNKTRLIGWLSAILGGVSLLVVTLVFARIPALQLLMAVLVGLGGGFLIANSDDIAGGSYRKIIMWFGIVGSTYGISLFLVAVWGAISNILNM